MTAAGAEVSEEVSENKRRARALPMFGAGTIPADRDRSVEDDTGGLAAVIQLFLRTWPYIRPQILGYWWCSRGDAQISVAGNGSGDGYAAGYAPVLVFIAVLAFPLIGLVPASLDWPWALLYVPAICVVGFSLVLGFAQGRAQTVGIVGTLLAALGMNLVATFLIDGYVDGVYAGLVGALALAGWLVQIRFDDQGFAWRVRIRSHLLYVYILVFVERMIALVTAVIIADFLNQSLLQNEPIAPGLAALFGIPQWAQGSVDALTKDQQHQLKWLYAGVALTGFLLEKIVQGIREYYGMWVLQMVNQDLRVALIERWHMLSLRYHGEHRTGDSVFRLYQDSSMITSVIQHLSSIVIAWLSYFASVALIALLSPAIGLLAALLLIPWFLLAAWAMPRMRIRSLVYRQTSSDVISTMQESFSAIRLIKAFDKGEETQARLEEDSVVALNAGFQVRLIIALVTIAMFTVAAVFMMGGEFVMAWWARSNEATFANELIALVGVSFVVWNLASFSWTRDQYRGSSAGLRALLNDWMLAQDMAMGLRRVFDILDLTPDVTDKPDAQPLNGITREIRFDKVAFAYGENRPTIRDVSFGVAPGTVTAIVGPTGSGKSTLMSLLLRLYDPQAGAISIDGVDLRDFSIDSLRHHIAIALQENVLFAMTVADNIRYVAPDASEAALADALRVSVLDEVVAGLPAGVDTLLSDRGGKLSTGQRQRISIARAVIRRTPILILDEPTAALDAVTEHRVMANLAEWARDDSAQRVVFVITHRISTIRRADQILFLNNGQIEEQGRHDALMQVENGRYRAFVEAETAGAGAGTDV